MGERIRRTRASLLSGCGREPVDGAALLDEVTAIFQKHLVMSEEEAIIAALWCIFAHAHNCFEHSPILAFLSAVYGSGKSTAMGVVGGLTRSKLVSHATPAVIFRFTDKHPNVVLGLDEGENYITRDNRDLVTVLDSGHKRTNASIGRCVGNDFEPQDFSTWGPKVIARVCDRRSGDLPPSLQQRSIPIRLKKKLPTEKVEDFTSTDMKGLKNEQAKKIARWTYDHRAELKAASPEIPPCLYNRARDNWKPLLAIAELAGGEWPQRARRAAERINGEVEDTTESVMLLKDCKLAFEGKTRLKSQELCSSLNKLETRPWCEMRYGEGIDPRGLGKMLAGFGIKSDDIRFEDGVKKGFERAQFEDVWARHLLPGDGGG